MNHERTKQLVADLLATLSDSSRTQHVFDQLCDHLYENYEVDLADKPTCRQVMSAEDQLPEHYENLDNVSATVAQVIVMKTVIMKGRIAPVHGYTQSASFKRWASRIAPVVLN